MTGPGRPCGIVGRDVDQNVRIDEDQPSPGLIRMMSLVERPGSAGGGSYLEPPEVGPTTFHGRLGLDDRLTFWARAVA